MQPKEAISEVCRLLLDRHASVGWHDLTTGKTAALHAYEHCHYDLADELSNADHSGFSTDQVARKRFGQSGALDIEEQLTLHPSLTI